MSTSRDHAGHLEVICGPMFSGKTEELIRRLRRALIAHQRVATFKHTLDKRFTLDCVASHAGGRIDAHALEKSEYILEYVRRGAIDVVGIDETQFFSADIVAIISVLVASGKRVIVAGLDLDFRGVPFGPMPVIMALADDVIKLKAVCALCQKDALHSQRLIDGLPAKVTDPTILIGSNESYQARCRACYVIGPSCESHLESERSLKS